MTLNEQVAKKLGWKKAQCQDAPGFITGKEWWTDRVGMPKEPPNYSGDIGAAWEIVEHLDTKDMSVSIFFGRSQTYNFVSKESRTDRYAHCQINGGLSNSGECSSVPEAICKAFLALPEDK
jgi:hypothetical protein